jgi:hypothetical protein
MVLDDLSKALVVKPKLAKLNISQLTDFNLKSESQSEF